MSAEQKEIFLTFDDGPVPGPTEFVLDTLKTFDAVATFFCIGDNIRKHPEIFQRVVDEGHTIGNHTFHHIKGWNTALQKYLDNVHDCESEIAMHKLPTGNPSLFRPPYGRITSGQIKSLKEKYRIVMWDVLTSDYDRSLSPERCLSGSIKATRNGSVVVFHDSVKAERNLTYVLPRYLEHFSNAGFTFKTLSER